MQQHTQLIDFLTEIQRQKDAKRDFTTSTQDNVRIVTAEDGGKPLKLVLLGGGGSEIVGSFSISENAHRQICARLKMGWHFYQRCLEDHPDIISDNCNKLFEREPESRMVRVLDGTVRAFLSDRYFRIDNAPVIETMAEHILPGVESGDLRIMSAYAGPDKMYLKGIYTGDDLAHTVAEGPNGEPRVIRPGFRASNSETGNGSLDIQGFFFDGYCTNGCVWGIQEAFTLKRRHTGHRVLESEGYIVESPEAQKLELQAILARIGDAIKSVSNKEYVDQMAASLRRAAQTDQCQAPAGAVELAVKELDLLEVESSGILQTFLRDHDYSQFGLASAVTEQANTAESYERACELEDIGAQILTLSMRQWDRFVTAQPAALAA